MTPELIRSGPLFRGPVFREIAVSTNASGDSLARIAALGFESNGRDILHVLDVGQETISALEVPSRESLGWRLALTRGPVCLYRNGKVFECTLVPVLLCLLFLTFYQMMLIPGGSFLVSILEKPVMSYG